MRSFFFLLFLFVTPPLFADEGATGIVQGTIATTDGQPAAFVTVQLRGTAKAAITDEAGVFSFKHVRAGHYILDVSLVGLQPQQQPVTVHDNQTTTVAITLFENAQQLSTVVVQARKSLNERITAIGKMPVQPKDLPQSITVLSGAVLERQQVQSMGDALQNVNGVYLMGTTGGVQEEIAARGYSFGSSNTFKNGARFNNGIKPEMSAVEKIEILKGGNAILFGNVGAGGVLNIVTKKPKFEQGGEIQFRTGSYNLYKPVLDVYGSFSKSHRAAYRLNATYEHAGSFRDGVTSDRVYVNPSFLFKLGAHTDLLLEGDYLNDKRTPDYGTGAIDYVVADVPRSTFLNVPWARNKTEQYTATATITHRFGKGLGLRGLVSYQNYNNNLFGATRPNASGAMISQDGGWLRGLQRTNTAEDYYYASLDLNAQFQTASIGHTVLFGADADQYYTTAHTFATYGNPAFGNKNVYDSINIFNPATFNTRRDVPDIAMSRITRSPIQRAGVYVQDLISVLDNLKVLAGVRYTYQANRRATVDTVAKGTQGAIAAYSNDAFSPRIGVVYQPAKTTSVFVSYTNTFQVNTGVDINNEALKPSIINQYEAGVKNDFFKGALTANVTLYQIDNSNLAQAAVNPPADAPNARELTGATRSKGVEVDVMTKEVRGFNIIAGYAYNDMRYTETREYKQDSRLRYNPAHTANASVFYSFAGKTGLKGLQVGLGAFYTGERLAGRSTTVARPDYKLMPLPDFVTVDVNAGYVAKAFSVRAKLSNLFNQLSYYAHDDNSINPIAPRQFVATFGYKF